MDTIRRYRNWIEDKDLVSFTLQSGESDLLIRAQKLLSLQAKQSLHKARRVIEDYIQEHPEFATTLKPYAAGKEAPEIIRQMTEAAFVAEVGPMAGVAGAVAEFVGRALLKYSPEVIVENGGDIFIKTNRVRKVGIFAGKSGYTGKLALELAPSQEALGICTSSGTVGPSLSFGHADAATAVCNSAFLADVWATRLGNMVKTKDDLEPTLKFVQQQPTIKGAVIIIGDKIGAWGEVKLVK